MVLQTCYCNCGMATTCWWWGGWCWWYGCPHVWEPTIIHMVRGDSVVGSWWATRETRSQIHARRIRKPAPAEQFSLWFAFADERSATAVHSDFHGACSLLSDFGVVAVFAVQLRDNVYWINSRKFQYFRLLVTNKADWFADHILNSQQQTVCYSQIYIIFLIVWASAQ